MTRQRRLQNRQKEKIQKIEYQYKLWSEYDYNILSDILAKLPAGSGKKESYNDCFIMLDTETSKKPVDITEPKHRGRTPKDNHICAFTVSIRSCSHNICTLYGAKPWDCVDCLEKICKAMPGQATYIYIFNMGYDWTFLWRFMCDRWGYPAKQLNIKPLYPLVIEFENPHIIFKDAYILAQRSLERFAKDLDVEHQKAVGQWNYDKIRDQSGDFTPEELEYIENDTLAGVECLDAMRENLHKHVYSMPYTATGINREIVQKLGKKHHAHQQFLQIAPDYRQLQKAEKCYHGGYVHTNRHFLDRTIIGEILGFDFASSYPFEMLTSPNFPMEKFKAIKNCSLDDILENADKYAFMFKLILYKVRLKNDALEMPCLQLSKCVKEVDTIVDNGKILAAGYVEIYLTEIDARLIKENYTWEKHLCIDVEYAMKGYLPRWFRDYIYECFQEKCTRKNGDPVLYQIAKSKINSLYGLTVQHPVRPEILQNYQTGEYYESSEKDLQQEYERYLKRYTSILPYYWGLWTTNGAMARLFELGACCEDWIYSDTDSVYGMGWDIEKVEAYNNKCKEALIAAGYGPIIHDNREYWLGIAEHNPEKDSYTEFRAVGAKRYCARSKADGKLHITVAGVPKKTGAACLRDDINNFTTGMIFDGLTTGKKTHFYLHREIYTDPDGNVTADSIDLENCDYKLKSETEKAWEHLFYETIAVTDYEVL